MQLNGDNGFLRRSIEFGGQSFDFEMEESGEGTDRFSLTFERLED